MSKRVRPGYYRQDINKTKWEVPERYRDLRQVGTGAYGTVWWVTRAWTDAWMAALCGAEQRAPPDRWGHTRSRTKAKWARCSEHTLLYFLIWWRQPRRHLGCSIPVAFCIFFRRTRSGWVILGGNVCAHMQVYGEKWAVFRAASCPCGQWLIVWEDVSPQCNWRWTTTGSVRACVRVLIYIDVIYIGRTSLKLNYVFASFNANDWVFLLSRKFQRSF